MENKSKFKKFFIRIFNWIKSAFRYKKAHKVSYQLNNSIGLLDNNTSYLTIIAENKSDKDFYLDIFSNSNNILPEEISFCFEENGNVSDVLQSIKVNKKFVNGMRYVTTTPQQISRWIDIKKVTMFGEVHSIPLKPLSYKTSYQNQNNQIDIPSYRFPLNDETRIGINLLPKEKINLIIQVDDFDSGQSKLKSGLY